VTLGFNGGPVGQALGRFRLSVTTSAEPLEAVSVRAKTRALVDQDPATRDPEDAATVRSAYRAQVPSLAPERERIQELEKALKDLGIVSALVMRERSTHERPSTFIRERGNFMSIGEKVYADTPRTLPPLPRDVMPNRLGLARWLVAPDNPLTARVVANRAWEQFFGRGLVETSEDFGTQGSTPSHPELLDWLATELVAQKWSLKSLHRLIATSATYRQSAAATPALLERDPDNRLLTRGPRFRMEAEMVRDVALAASGLLSSKIGGPSVFPPQPDGIWQNPYSSEKWTTSEGEDRYRRSLYTFIRRTSPYPSLMMFDATSREFCTVRRVRTNTPLQALVTLNDEAFFEAARALAARMLTEAPATTGTNGDGDRARAAYGFRLCTSRTPTGAELDRIVTSYEQQLAHFRSRPDAAAQVVGSAPNAGRPKGLPLQVVNEGLPLQVVNEGLPLQAVDPAHDAAVRAAWTMVANALLNLDETLTK
jgi:Protein of unknown function (DUF1553)